MTEFSVLGKTIQHPIGELEVFPTPDNVSEVKLTCHEFTSLCPVTGQPDFGTIEIILTSPSFCIESKSLKLWLWQYREKGSFCESLSSEIAEEIAKVTGGVVTVTVKQAPRGGIGIDATSIAFDPKSSTSTEEDLS